MSQVDIENRIIDILIVHDEDEKSKFWAGRIKPLLNEFKLKPDVDTRKYNERLKSTEKMAECSRVLFILNTSDTSKSLKKKLSSWLEQLNLVKQDGEDYLVLVFNKNVPRKIEGNKICLNDGVGKCHIIHVKEEMNVFEWWPLVLKFLCKKINYEKSAYILIHAGFDIYLDNGNEMIDDLKAIETAKKTIEMMLQPFGPRNLHNPEWIGGASFNAAKRGFKLFRSVAPIAMQAAGMDLPVPINGVDLSEQLEKVKDAEEKDHIKEIWTTEKRKIDALLAPYAPSRPQKPSFSDFRFASVVPIFVVLNADISVDEKCCLAGYAREYDKSHVLCISKTKPSEYLHLVSKKVYGCDTQMEFIFSLLKDLKVIDSIKGPGKDSPCTCICCSHVCTVL